MENILICRDELMLVNGGCRERVSRKRSTAWPPCCLEAAFIPVAIAVTEARQRASQVVS
jgi:hypothetical protein